MTVLLRLGKQHGICSKFERMVVIFLIFCLLSFKWKSKLTIRSSAGQKKILITDKYFCLFHTLCVLCAPITNKKKNRGTLSMKTQPETQNFKAFIHIVQQEYNFN